MPADFKQHAKRQQVILCSELLFTLALVIVFKFTLINSLWDQKYLDLIISDWKKGPITDVTLVTQLNKDGEIAYFPDDCPSGYDIAA